MRLKWLACAVLFAPIAANANVVLTAEAPGVQSSQVAGVTTENFDGFTPGIYTSLNTAVGSFSSPGMAVQPADVFGGAGGAGNYFVIGAESGQLSAELTLPGSEEYFGMWLSALDSGNGLELLNGSTVVASYNPDAVLALVGSSGPYYGNPNNGGDSGEPFAYLNFIATGGTTFDHILFTNAGLGSGFEMDNMSIDATAPVTNPGTPVGGGITPLPSAVSGGLVLMAGLLGATYLRRSVKPA